GSDAEETVKGYTSSATRAHRPLFPPYVAPHKYPVLTYMYVLHHATVCTIVSCVREYIHKSGLLRVFMKFTYISQMCPTVLRLFQF
ncbi:unnamed protein product, partial [Leptidea sinapis]